MASKNIVAKGTTYNGVESVTLPVSGGGDATFYEISDTTAAAADVASGKYFYTALGVLTQGTASGGGGSTGLVYETGTWTPSEDVASYVIQFTNTHTIAPFYYTITDSTGLETDQTSSNFGVTYYDYAQLSGEPLASSSTDKKYGRAQYEYRSTGSSIQSGGTNMGYPYTNMGNSSVYYPRYWATESGIKAYTASDTRYWRSARTYKWIAVWAPTT